MCVAYHVSVLFCESIAVTYSSKDGFPFMWFVAALQPLARMVQCLYNQFGCSVQFDTQRNIIYNQFYTHFLFHLARNINGHVKLQVHTATSILHKQKHCLMVHAILMKRNEHGVYNHLMRDLEISLLTTDMTQQFFFVAW